MLKHRHPLFMQVCLLSCLLLALCFPSHGWADDHILEKACWTDTSGSANFEEARSASYTPYDQILSKGYNSHAQWIRLKIGAAPSQSQESYVLRMRPVYLDEITLYDPVYLERGQPPRTTGDWTPWQSTEFESLHHTFLIPAQAQPRYVWLRLTTNSTQLLQVEALTPREMLRQEHILWLMYSGLLALILCFSMWVFLACLRALAGSTHARNCFQTCTKANGTSATGLSTPMSKICAKRCRRLTPGVIALHRFTAWATGSTCRSKGYFLLEIILVCRGRYPLPVSRE